MKNSRLNPEKFVKVQASSSLKDHEKEGRVPGPGRGAGDERTEGLGEKGAAGVPRGLGRTQGNIKTCGPTRRSEGEGCCGGDLEE